MKIWKVVKNCIVVILIIILCISFKKIDHDRTCEYIWEVMSIWHYDFNKDNIGVDIDVIPRYGYWDDEYEVSLVYKNKVVNLPTLPVSKYKDDRGGNFVQGLYFDSHCKVESEDAEYSIKVYEEKITIKSNEYVYMEAYIRPVYRENKAQNQLLNNSYFRLQYTDELTIVSNEEHFICTTKSEFKTDCYPDSVVVLYEPDENGEYYTEAFFLDDLKEPVNSFEVRRKEDGKVSAFFDLNYDGIYETEYKEYLVE